MIRLIGRARELSALRRILGDAARSIAVIGPGGIGKSALVRALLSGTPGVIDCDCENVRTRAEVLEAVARAARLTTTSRPRAAEVARGLSLRDARILLLDGCDGFDADAVACSSELIADSRMTVITTSRRALGLPDEQVLVVGPLPTAPHASEPAHDASDAQALFCARVRVFDGAFSPSREQRALIDGICLLLEGYPLAIELTAPWLKVMSLEEIVRRLKSASLPPLASAPGSKYATMDAVVGASVERLTDAERVALACLSVFQTPFGFAGAEAVLGPVAPASTILALRDQSLVQSDGGVLSIFAVVRRHALSLVAPEVLDGGRSRHAEYLRTCLNALIREPTRTPEWMQRLNALGPESIRAATFALSKHGAAGARVALDIAWALLTPANLGTQPEQGRVLVRELVARDTDRSAMFGPAERVKLSLLRVAQLGEGGALLDEVTAGMSLIADEPPTLRAECHLLLRSAHANNARSGAERDQLRHARAAGGDDLVRTRVELAETFGTADVETHPDVLARALEMLERAETHGSSLLYMAAATSFMGPLVDAAPRVATRVALRLSACGRAFGSTRASALAQAVLLATSLESGERRNDQNTATSTLAALADAGLVAWARLLCGSLALDALRRKHPREARRWLDAHERISVRYNNDAFVPALRARLDASEGVHLAPAAFAVSKDAHTDVRLATALERVVCEVLLVGRPDDRLRAELRAAALAAKDGSPRSHLLRMQLASLRSFLVEAGVGKELALVCWRIGPEVEWVERPDGRVVELGPQAVLRAVLKVLLEARARTPGTPVPSAELASRAWPGERMLRRSSRDRAKTAIARLRRRGLGELVRTARTGYLLVADSTLEMDAPRPPRRST